MSNPIDYSAHQPEAPTDNVLGQISSFVDIYTSSMQELKRAQEVVDTIQSRIDRIIQKDIPDIMDLNRLTDISTATGVKVKMEEKITASVPKTEAHPRRALALKWLADNGHGDIIKTEVVAKFGRGDMEFAKDLRTTLEHDSHVPAVELSEKVNANTLGALVRELIATGKECPQETLGVFRKRNAKIVMPKKKAF